MSLRGSVWPLRCLQISIRTRLGAFLADSLPHGRSHDSYEVTMEVSFFARSTAILLDDAKCTARFIQPGKPWQNGFMEAFHSTLLLDKLDAEVLFNLLDAQLKAGIYRNHYKQVRPHPVLGYKAPIEYANIKTVSLL